MKIVRCDRSHAQQWDAFVTTSPAASAYHRFCWKAVNEEVLGHRTYYLGAMAEDNRLVGIFPIVQMKSMLFGNIACSLPFVNYGGPCAETPEVERLLLDEAKRLCDELRVDYLEIRSRHHLGDDLPSAEHKVSLTLELQSDPEVLWKAFTTGHRQQIRRGYKNGLTAKSGGVELLDPFYDVISESWRNLGTPIYPKRYFRAVADALGTNFRLCVIFAGNDPAGAAFDATHRDTVEGMWLGTKAQYRDKLVGYVLYWELIKDACERGFGRFHLGRSTVDSGSEAFKKKWNASVTQLYWHYVLRRQQELPQLRVTNPRYQLAISTWRRLPVGVTRLVGPLIARSIP
jgi:FemAB-related protein (PEP-CTERM system-associated)